MSQANKNEILRIISQNLIWLIVNVCMFRFENSSFALRSRLHQTGILFYSRSIFIADLDKYTCARFPFTFGHENVS